MDFKDLTGQKFNRLTVIRKAKNYSGGRTLWVCQCECGKEIFVNGYNLRQGFTKSCGCLQKEIATKNCKLRTKHNLINSSLYTVWASMKQRCSNKNGLAYKNYGGRGITICDEWVNDFQAFYDWAINNGYKHNLTIDRINNDGNYEPSNCRWVTRSVQAKNRRSNHYITFNSETHIISDWAKLYNIPLNVFCRRLKRGWSFEDAVSKPIIKYKSKSTRSIY